MKCKFCQEEHKNNNTGCRNSGYRNSGHYNSGYYNSGHYNSGYYNSGYYNSGDRNSGHYNSGYYNSGDYNSGDRNSGDRNSGDRNSGHYNSGYYNSGNFNSGWFNTDEPKMRFFNKESVLTYSEFIKGKVVYPDLKICSWVEHNNLPKEEQTNITSQMGGKLKTLTYKEAWKEYWNRASEEDKQWFQNLPNFDAKIFEKITGIDIAAKTNLSDDELVAELEKRGRIKNGKIIT